MTRQLYTYRRYIWQTAWNDLRYRYAGTGLGIFWNIINPILEVLIYTVVFSQILIIRNGSEHSAPFLLYLCMGLFPWLYFSETILRGSNAFIENAIYLKRLSIPAEIFLAKNVLSVTFSLLLALFLLLPLSLFLGEPFSWHWLFMPILVLLLQGLALSLALALACLRVFFRDLGEILRTLMQLWKWTIPVVYPESLLPENLRGWLVLNPPYVFIESIRSIALDQQLPNWSKWSMMLAWIGIFGVFGLIIMHHLRFEIRDNL